LEAKLKEYAELASDYANEKIKCFTEKITPIKKISIEFICADNGAHNSIKDLLNEKFKDQGLC
jgi:hypothetical protein